MRDAFGGVFMMRLILVFIFIYVGFTAISLNYAKAFRVKNYVIDMLEQNEITLIESDETKNPELNAKIDLITEKANYNIECETEGLRYCHNGITIYAKQFEEEEENPVNKKIYVVETKAEWSVGFLNKILVLGGKQENSGKAAKGTWTITGEAEVIVKK